VEKNMSSSFLRAMAPMIAVVALAACGGNDSNGSNEASGATAPSADVSDVRAKLVAGITETGEISEEQANCIADGAIDTFDAATLEVLTSEADNATAELLDEKAGAGTSDKLIEITSACVLGESASQAADSTSDPAAAPAAGEPTSTDAPTPTDPPAPSGPGSSLDDPAPLGAPADVGGGWSYGFAGYLADAGEVVAAANEFNEAAPAGQQYVMVVVNASYSGPEDKSSVFLGPTLKAVGGSKKSYNQYDCAAALPDQLDITADVFSGSSVSGNVCFIVDSADAASLTIYTEGFDENFDQQLVYFATS
jgi:hypothetical protein